VIAAWQSWAPHAPDELWSNLHLAAAPDGAPPDGPGPSIQVGGTYLGSAGAAAAELDKLYAAVGSEPSSPFVESVSWLHAMLVEAGCAGLTVSECHLPTQTSDGKLSRASEYAKSDYFTTPLSSHAIGTLLSGVEAFQRAGGAPGSSGGIAFDALGGAVNRVAPSATAFVHRDALFQAQYTTTWPARAAPAAVARQRAWQQSFWQSMRRYASGQAYQNYVDPALATWRQAYYGANFGRLARVKAAYDPDRIFAFPQAV
jgi:FAD/FMN-containing dehydrogenase